MVQLNAIGKLVKHAWLMIGIILLQLCMLEGSLALAFLLKDWWSGPNPSTTANRVIADTYSDPSWVQHYYTEFLRSNAVQWRSYVYWRRRPYRGEYINIDPHGIRLTTVPEPRPQASSPSVKIFMFGGSTLWGTGARDAFTIPSLLAKELQDRGVVSTIMNFGETGYVSTQEVILLLLQLQQGCLPDVVIFYDGINDTFSAYQQHVAGLPQNEFNRVKEFNLLRPEKVQERRSLVLQDLANSLATARVLQHVLRRSSVGSEAGSVVHPLGLDKVAPDRESLAREVLGTYIGNIELVKALSEHYRFKFLFYWQPTIFEKVHVTPYERGHREKMQALEPFFQQTYDVIRQSRLAEKRGYAFHDLSRVFADVQAPVYVDWAHLGELGHEILAKSMVHDVLSVMTPHTGAAEQSAAPDGDSTALHCRRLVRTGEPE